MLAGDLQSEPDNVTLIILIMRLTTQNKAIKCILCINLRPYNNCLAFSIFNVKIVKIARIRHKDEWQCLLVPKLTMDVIDKKKMRECDDYQLSQSEKVALRERVKELTCLYNIAQIARQPDKTLSDILQSVVNLLPSAWQYPESTLARISLDGIYYSMDNFSSCLKIQSSDIYVDEVLRGKIEVGYTKNQPELDEGPFLKEERNLLNEIARQVALIIEHNQIHEDKIKLYNQLRHSDRLATVGILAAGVAHELNEPVGNILGFAQLAKKTAGIPVSAIKDIEKIEKASLDAREIIRKLLVFSRQVPPEKKNVNLNEIVKNGIQFLSEKCVNEGIEVVCSLFPNLPEIAADAVQLNQVLVNLMVNAVQSMEAKGGKIEIETKFDDQDVCLSVKDTGQGMTREVLDKIFTPFFTTKDVGHGTGLGLPLAHGIVTSHNGSISVESKTGEGTCFEVRIPINGTPKIRRNL